jgi:N-acetyl-anhydromuramyl-L-alanine amidase AmpD
MFKKNLNVYPTQTGMENLYDLTDFNPLGSNSKKKQIILTETKRSVRNYINSLKYRYNKKNPYLPNYVIEKTGQIYQIMNPENYSNYMGQKSVDENAIIISIENLGWLKKNPLDNTFVNWVGDIYKKEVYEKKWRDYFFWDPHKELQINKLSELIIELCDDFNIPKKCLGHNVKEDGVENFNGIVTKSNFNFIYRDVNPSFDFKLLKKNIENDEPI